MNTLTTFSLQVLTPNTLPHGFAHRLAEDDKRVLANLPAYVESWQEDMSDLLPEGYEVKIVEAMT